MVYRAIAKLIRVQWQDRFLEYSFICLVIGGKAVIIGASSAI